MITPDRRPPHRGPPARSYPAGSSHAPRPSPSARVLRPPQPRGGPRSASARCSCTGSPTAHGSPGGSSRSRPTSATEATRARTRIAGRRRATARCSARRAVSTSTAATACTPAPTWCAKPAAGARPCCCARSSPATESSACARCAVSPAQAPERAIASGPGRLAQALGITLADDGRSLLRGALVLHRPSPGAAPARVAVSARIGLTHGAELPYRFFDPQSACVSRARPGSARPFQAAKSAG